MTTGIILDFLTIHSIILLGGLTCRIEKNLREWHIHTFI